MWMLTGSEESTAEGAGEKPSSAGIPGMGASREASTQPGLGGSGSIGILFDRTSPAGPFTIQGVTPGSTAALCGRIAAGDLLHGVGETPVYELDRQQAMALLLGRDGSDVTLWTSKAPTDGEPRPPVTGVKVKRDLYANAVERESRNGVEASSGESIGWNPASFTVLSTTPKPLHTVLEYPSEYDRGVFDTCLN